MCKNYKMKMFQIEVFVLKCSLDFLPNLEVTSTVSGFGSRICLGLWEFTSAVWLWKSRMLFGALEVTSAVWGFGSHICLGLWKSHLFGALEVISVWGFGSHICLGLWKSHLLFGFGSHICLGLWKLHLLFGALEVTSAVWGCGSHMCLGLWKSHQFGALEVTYVWGFESHICCLAL